LPRIQEQSSWSICDRSIENKKRRVQEAYNVTQFYNNYEEMSDNNDVVSLRQEGMLFPVFFGEEFLYRGEHETRKPTYTGKR
jgi:hypothetical protein